MPEAGGITFERGGGKSGKVEAAQRFDPERWLLTASRSLKRYAEDAFHRTVKDDNGNPCGLDVYDIRMVWPGTEKGFDKVPLSKTIVHFEIDSIRNEAIGGDDVFYSEYDPVNRTVIRQAVSKHFINFDVGIWTSDRAGGLTERMRAYELLNNIFLGSLAQESIMLFTNDGDGYLELMEFTGGRFLTERINDVNMYRTINSDLLIRVYSRTPKDLFPPAPAIEEIFQDPHWWITDNPYLTEIT